MAKQDDPIVKTTVRLRKSLLNATKHRAIDDDVDMNTVVIRALEEYLAKRGSR
jgi:hypothetical protein